MVLLLFLYFFIILNSQKDEHKTNANCNYSCHLTLYIVPYHQDIISIFPDFSNFTIPDRSSHKGRQSSTLLTVFIISSTAVLISENKLYYAFYAQET